MTTNTETKSYHIYIDDRCIFKNLNEEEFQLIWNKLYTSYNSEITYLEVTDTDITQEHSY
jgi:hypothetical protein